METKDTLQQRCVQCQGRRVGVIGNQRYFCLECCIEFTVNEKGTIVYSIGADGVAAREASESTS